VQKTAYPDGRQRPKRGESLMLDMKRREFIALLGAGGLLLAVKVRRTRAQQPAMPVIGFMRARAGGFGGGARSIPPRPEGRRLHRG
jgi:hypothetical protein